MLYRLIVCHSFFAIPCVSRFISLLQFFVINLYLRVFILVCSSFEWNFSWKFAFQEYFFVSLKNLLKINQRLSPELLSISNSWNITLDCLFLTNRIEFFGEVIENEWFAGEMQNHLIILFIKMLSTCENGSFDILVTSVFQHVNKSGLQTNNVQTIKTFEYCRKLYFLSIFAISILFILYFSSIFVPSCSYVSCRNFYG